MPEKREKQPKRTEAQMTALLRKRFTARGNGGAGEYAFMAQVRNKAGFDATRTFDAVVMSLWPSRGLSLHGFEIKCSRSDWVKELRQPDKAEAAAALVDRFSLVVADEAFVKDGELPDTWGLLAVRGDKLVEVKAAPLLPEAVPGRAVSRSFVVCMLRAAGAVPVAEPEEMRLARKAGFDEAHDLFERQLADERERFRQLQVIVAEFEKAAGFSIRGGWMGGSRRTPEDVAAAVRTALAGDDQLARTRRQLSEMRDQLRRAVIEMDRLLAAEGGDH